MSAFEIKGAAGEIQRIQALIEDTKKKINTVVAEIAVDTVKTLSETTPVWEGYTIRNYAVGIGKMPTGEKRADTSGGGPENTNELPLGPELRRPANHALAMADAQQAVQPLKNSTKLVNVFIGNTGTQDNWSGINGAQFPVPGRSRIPAALDMRTVQTIKDKYREVVK